MMLICHFTGKTHRQQVEEISGDLLETPVVLIPWTLPPTTLWHIV